MTKHRIAAIIAAATLGAAAFTGAAVALAANDTPSPSASESAPSRDGEGSRGMDGQGSRKDGPAGHGPQEGNGPHEGHEPREHGPSGRGSHGPGSHGPGGGMLHSEGVIEDDEGAFVTVRMQQGEVTAVSATSITVLSADGYSATYVITDETVVERNGDELAPAVGDTAHVRATVTGSTATADTVHALSPEKAKELQERHEAMEDGMAQRPERAGGPGRA